MKKTIFFLVGFSVIAVIAVAQPTQIINVSKTSPAIQQSLLAKKKVVLAKGVMTDLKVNKPSGVTMTLRMSNFGGKHKKSTNYKKNTSKWD